MTFLSPLMLIGLEAASIPVVIHLIGRRRARKQPFPAIDFLLRSNRRVARHMRMRQILLLLVRSVLVAAIVLMVAKPACETESRLPSATGGPQSAVLILDDTLSMGRHVDGQILLVRAKQQATELLELMGAPTEIAILSVSGASDPLPTLSRDLRKAKRAISRLPLTSRHATLNAAIARAGQLLGNATLQQRNVFVISDMAAHGLGQRDQTLPPGIGLHPIDVAPGAPANNRAVVALRTAASTAPGHRSVQIVAHICNFGPQTARTEVRLQIDGRLVTRGNIVVNAGQCLDKRFHHAFARGGRHEVSVSLPPDDLPADDRRYLQVEARADIRVLLVNGSPSPIRHRDELFYLHSALETTTATDQRLVPTTLRVEDLGPRRLADIDVVVLCNVANLHPKQTSALDAFVHRGGGLLITLGDNVKADRFNNALGPLLPQQLRGALTMAIDGAEGALHLGRVDSNHPLVAPLWRPKQGAGLRRARFHRVYRLRPLAGGERQVVMHYDDGSPALVEAQRGAGRVLLLTSTIDRDWTDLPIRPGYLPLLQQTIRYLGRAPAQRPGRDLLAGAVHAVAIPARFDRIQLVTPEPSERSWSSNDLAGRQTVDVKAEKPGFYRLSTLVEGKPQPLARESFVVNVDPAESRLEKGSLRTHHVSGKAGPRAIRRVEIWHALGAALLLLLLLESLLTRRG